MVVALNQPSSVHVWNVYRASGKMIAPSPAKHMPLNCYCGNPTNTWRNNNVVTTSKRRHFHVIVSKWRRFDVITTWYCAMCLLGNLHAKQLWSNHMKQIQLCISENCMWPTMFPPCPYWKCPGRIPTDWGSYVAFVFCRLDLDSYGQHLFHMHLTYIYTKVRTR